MNNQYGQIKNIADLQKHLDLLLITINNLILGGFNEEEFTYISNEILQLQKTMN